MNALSVKPASGVAAGSSVATTASSMQLLSTSVAAAAAEKNKQWQRELLMERIRSHSTQHKTFPELSKSMRMSMLEKRYALDSVEKSNLQKCLDSMQHCIKVTSRQGLVERLESLSRQLGLKLSEDPSGLFISTDMFYLEIILDVATGALTDVKVHHECKIEQQSCSELVNCLKRGDFADFTVQLEGLSSIYQLNAEPKVKTKAFVALQAMETDLYNLYQMQQFDKNTPQQLLEESTVGIVLRRRGGHPMKLTYFVAPYDLIALDAKCMQALSLDLLHGHGKEIGMNVTLNLEAASANKLQILPTVTFSKDAPSTGIESLPLYAPLTQLNSTLLPATFVLRLNKPLPVCSATLRTLLPSGAATAGECATMLPMDSKSNKATTVAAAAGAPSTIMNLIVQTASDQQLKNSSKGLFVCLPDQTHCYFFTDNKQLKASLVSSVPFTEPAQVPKILAFLKKQALLYTLLASCVRPQTKMGNDMDSTTILEVNAISFQQISVSLQHPYEESMATVEFNLNESAVNCTIYSLSRNYDLLSLKLTKIVQKSLSIPVTLRALLKFWDQERIKMFKRGIGTAGNGSGSAGIGGNGANVNNGSSSGGSCSQGNNGFGNFSLAVGPNDPGGGRTGLGIGSNGGSQISKMESNAAVQQRQYMTNVTGGNAATTAGIAGYLKFKTDIKQEDFHESPKSQIQNTQMQSVEASSLGQKNIQQQPPLQQTQHASDISTLATATGMPTDFEIADKYKNIWKDKTPNLKNSVSITPIINALPESKVATTSQNLEMKRTGIEIIPLTTQTAGVASGGCTAASQAVTSASTSITITAINNVSSSNAKSEKKNFSSTSGSSSKRGLDSVPNVVADAQKEKKRKKRRDDSPMGPPEKVFSRQNSPATTSSSAAGAEVVARKFSSPSSSPKGASGGLLATATTSSSLSARPSPKHSPVYSSPKHHSTASNSPKSPFGSTHSPKHGSSGKPSMSTLKSAAASLSPKADRTNSNLVVGAAVTAASVTIASRPSLQSSGNIAVGGAFVASSSATGGAAKSRSDKEKSSAAYASSILSPSSAVNKANSSASVSLQQTKSSSASSLNHLTVASSLSGTFNAIGGGGVGAATVSLDAMRKGVSSGAVSLMTSIAVSAATTTHPQHGNTNASEYMVKQSQEGLKLTINKTSASKSGASKTKGYSSSANTVAALSSQSPTKKLHTGLKPGVNSGPASKKSPATSPAHSNITLTSSGTATTTSSASTTATMTKNTSDRSNTKHIFQKSNSSGNLSKFSSYTSATTGRGSSNANSQAFPTDSFRKSSSSSGYGKKGSSGERERTSTSQPATRLDHQADMMKILQYASPAMAANMEGFMKNLSTKFQIPKLSQRSNTPTTTAIGASTATQTLATVARTTSAPTTLTSNAPSFFITNTKNESFMKRAATTFTSQQQQQALHDSNVSVTQQQSAIINEFQRTNNEKKNLTMTPPNARPPPPPYHATVAAVNTAAVTSATTTNTQPSLSVHILKSSPGATVAAEVHDLSTNASATADDVGMIVAAAGVAGK